MAWISCCGSKFSLSAWVFKSPEDWRLPLDPLIDGSLITAVFFAFKFSFRFSRAPSGAKDDPEVLRFILGELFLEFFLEEFFDDGREPYGELRPNLDEVPKENPPPVLPRLPGRFRVALRWLSTLDGREMRPLDLVCRRIRDAYGLDEAPVLFFDPFLREMGDEALLPVRVPDVRRVTLCGRV